MLCLGFGKQGSHKESLWGHRIHDYTAKLSLSHRQVHQSSHFKSQGIGVIMSSILIESHTLRHDYINYSIGETCAQLKRIMTMTHSVLSPL